MGFLLIAAFAFGGIAFLLGGLTSLALFLTSLGRLFRGQVSVAVKELLLFFLCTTVLGVCTYLFNSQPVVWPWAPWHIPIYALAIGIFAWSRRAQLRWEREANERAHA
ncbi:hypothetical protein GCM10028796_21450 [Ramlibacter monticola]